MLFKTLNMLSLWPVNYLLTKLFYCRIVHQSVYSHLNIFLFRWFIIGLLVKVRHLRMSSYLDT